MCTEAKFLNMGFTEERFPVGAHVGLIYQSEEERQALMSKFLEAGLRDGGKVLCRGRRQACGRGRRRGLERRLQRASSGAPLGAPLSCRFVRAT